MKKTSVTLVCSLLATTTFIVNCSKTPDKRLLRPQTAIGAGALTADGQKAEPVPTESCQKDVIDSQQFFITKLNDLKKLEATQNPDQAVKDGITKLRQDMIELCKTHEGLFAKYKTASCLVTDKTSKKAIYKSETAKTCNDIGVALKAETQQDNAYAQRAEAEKAQAEELEKFNKLVGSKYSLSADMAQMTLTENKNWKSIIVDKVVSKSETTLQAALAAQKPACTVVSETDLKVDDKSELIFLGLGEVTDSKVLPANYKGAASQMSFQVKDSSDLFNLVCINSEYKKMSLKHMQNILGQNILKVKEQASVGAGNTDAGATASAITVVSSTATVSETVTVSETTTVSPTATVSTTAEGSVTVTTK